MGYQKRVRIECWEVGDEKCGEKVHSISLAENGGENVKATSGGGGDSLSLSHSHADAVAEEKVVMVWRNLKQ